MARPTASLTVYLQQFGRALRTMTGKSVGLVIDLVSNVKRHGLPDKQRFWSLDRRERRGKRNDPEDIPVKSCRNKDCLRAYPGELPSCPYCGYRPLPMPGGGRSIAEVEGDLFLLDASMLAVMRKAAALEQPGDIAARLAGSRLPHGAMIGQVNRQIERIEAQKRLNDSIALWAGWQAAKGRPDDEIYRRFYHGTGGVDVVTALGLPRVDMDKIDVLVRGWLADGS